MDATEARHVNFLELYRQFMERHATEPDEREAVIRDLERIASPVAATETGVRQDA